MKTKRVLSTPRRAVGSVAAKAGIARAIEKVRRNGTALHKLAREAGVAPAAVFEIREHEFGPKSENPKEMAGKAQTLTRLTLYLNRHLEPEDQLELSKVLSDFNIDPNASEIDTAIRNVEAQQGDHRHISDPVLRQIALRKNVVRVGALRSHPFFDESDTPSSSWSADYASRLVGTINPAGWRDSEGGPLAPIEPIDDFETATAALGAGSSKLDGIIGVYDTVNKRLKGLRFLNLPGIAMPLSYVSVGRTISWDQILSCEESFRREMQALVIEEEVGDLFLLGPCQYPIEKLERTKIADIKHLVSLFLNLARRDINAPIFFCADRIMCRSFYQAAKRFLTTEQSLLNVIDKLHLSTPYPQGPKYRVGFAVRSDAEVWLELLRHSQAELFQNAAVPMAQCYASLLKRAAAKEADGTFSADIELIPLDIPEHSAKLFVEKCKSFMGEELRQIYKDKLPEWETWTQARHG